MLTCTYITLMEVTYDDLSYKNQQIHSPPGRNELFDNFFSWSNKVIDILILTAIIVFAWFVLCCPACNIGYYYNPNPENTTRSNNVGPTFDCCAYVLRSWSDLCRVSWWIGHHVFILALGHFILLHDGHAGIQLTSKYPENTFQR